MTKEEFITLLKVMSALESWAFAEKRILPEYLHEELHFAMQIIERELLK